jgi:hypothetical protein
MKKSVIFLMIAALTACTDQKTNGWYRGNTHAHSTYSDGDTDVKDVIQWYHDNNYHFLFVTDHNYPLKPDSLQLSFTKRSDFILIPGNEVSDEQVIHTSSLNTVDRVPTIGYYRNLLKEGALSEADFDALPTTRSDIMTMHVTDILKAGGLPVLNHPNFVSGVQVADIMPVKELKHIELFNGHPSVYNWGNETHSAVEIKWDSILIHGKLVFGLASDDTHQLKKKGREYANPGRGWIMVDAESLDFQPVMNAIKLGDFYASTGVFLKDYRIKNNVISVVVDEKATLDEIKTGRGYPRNDLKDLPPGCFITFIGYNGKILKSVNALQAKYTMNPADKYIRVRVSYNIERQDNLDVYYAWTQPVEAEKGFFKNR